MAPILFISYSRRETLFANDLYHSLTEKGQACWLDYRNLVPGYAWLEQIEDGIEDSSVVLVVVSKASLASANVRREYEYALSLKKRVILAVFQAEPLPPSLQGLEWVDFRGSFSKGVSNLLEMISQPPVQPLPFPVPGFSMPLGMWGIFMASIATAILALPALFTGVVPLYLLPLPYQMLKREYEYFRVGVSVIILPVVLTFTAALFSDDLPGFVGVAWLASFLWAPFFFFLLQAKTLRRWVQPVAARPNSIPKVKISTPAPAPLRFGVDYAAQDANYARDFIQQMQAEGHKLVNNDEPMDAAFVFISTYKRETIYNVDSQVVYPIILQDVIDLPRPLQRLQWLDFRRGLRNVQALARLLHDPRKLLDALGSIPLGHQVVMPYMVQMMVYLFLLSGVFSVTGWVPTIWFLGGRLANHPSLLWLLLYSVPILLITLGISVYASRSLAARRGWVATWQGLCLAYGILIVTSVLAFAGVGLIIELIGSEMNAGGLGPALGPFSFSIGFLVILALLPFLWRDLYRWLPAKS